ncbi:hypothetical protein GGP95_001227 [Salinibacter ruber]|nr:hypothetical protein [Salinibacter ruber]
MRVLQKAEPAFHFDLPFIALQKLFPGELLLVELIGCRDESSL